LGEDFVERSRDWYRQAERDLQHARHSVASKDYEWACFASQQSAEKALKALYQVMSGEGWGHSVFALIEGLSEKLEVSENLRSSARFLDRLYIPTRYPNGFDQGIPADYFMKEDADRAIEESGEILEFVRPHIP
jgi:HEPN domain-containing protein